ncbi:LmbU family transcriptional regulator [Actinoplanes flavus]|uniref:LmbU family transcriptional regulator n=1 Tax=Actinoplanes flavus TaxID=2820290 RepID=A0ABS3USB3_9ACTN|nr:LmbU family transcriptional regulator [Actinoplanes flavus]MBO3741473.1 LmbU family transcriptional regulator [Actinoplanes flavus]
MGGDSPVQALDGSAFVTRRGLVLPHQMPFDRWLGVGGYLCDVYSSSAWCLGDWLVYGETAYRGRYQDAVKLTQLDYQTLRNHAWVARRFPMSRRREGLSFTHHAEVAALSEPEQEFWLRKAEEYAWSAKRLRREVKDSLLERTDDGHGGRAGGAGRGAVAVLNMSIPVERLESFQQAASRLGLPLETWAERALASAAAQACDEQPRLTATRSPHATGRRKRS